MARKTRRVESAGPSLDRGVSFGDARDRQETLCLGLHRSQYCRFSRLSKVVIEASFGGRPGEFRDRARQCHIRDCQAWSRQISLLKGAANGIVVPVEFRGNEQSCKIAV
jgi:hypothetical protein